VHVVPVGDVVGHDVEHGDECLCGPTVEPVMRDDGSCGWLYIHHALDGREFSEPDHQGPPESREGM
jgi:hypothetical protein